MWDIRIPGLSREVASKINAEQSLEHTETNIALVERLFNRT
jgi:hypothetical protein